MKRLSRFLALITCITVALATVAYAADPAPAVVAPTAPQAVANFLQATVFPIIASLFTGVLAVFVQRLGEKYKIEALAQKDNILTQLAYQGITLAEEKAAQLIGSKSALTGNDKLDIAVSHILSAMPKISPERAKAITEATLAQIPGVGATGNQAFSFGPIIQAFTAPLVPEATTAAAPDAATA
jgi:hypothetical protein